MTKEIEKIEGPKGPAEEGPKGPGSIGNTKAGKYLDFVLVKYPLYKNTVIRFIEQVTVTCKFLHATWEHKKNTQNEKNIKSIFRIVRDHYLLRINNEWTEYDPLIISLGKNYVTTLTTYNFIPSSKTQRELMN